MTGKNLVYLNFVDRLGFAVIVFALSACSQSCVRMITLNVFCTWRAVSLNFSFTLRRLFSTLPYVSQLGKQKNQRLKNMRKKCLNQ